jgi:hypothetical protein
MKEIQNELSIHSGLFTATPGDLGYRCHILNTITGYGSIDCLEFEPTFFNQTGLSASQESEQVTFF